MSKADKERIKELECDIRRKMDEIGALSLTLAETQVHIREQREELQREKEKYCFLLEKYILMMERTAGINDQSAD